MNNDLNLSPILIVEDNPVDLDLTLRAFSRNNVANPIQIGRDGEEALYWIKRWEDGERIPAVVLLDLKLPKVDGIEVIRQYKAHPQFRSIPIVVLTSSTEDEDIEEAYQLGVNSYIVKPVDFDKFTNVVKQIELYWGVLNKCPSIVG